MTSYVGNILASIATQYLPIEDMSVKLTVGLMINELTNHVISYSRNKISESLVNPCKKKDVTVKISNVQNNPIYYKLEEYMVNKFYDEIMDCNFIPKNGDINISLKPSSFKRRVEDKFKNHIVYLSLEEINKEYFIIMEIKNVKDIKIYNEYITTVSSDIDKQVSRLLKIHKPNIVKSKDDTHVSWNTVYVTTNKTFKNTIVADDVKKDLYDDIHWFINSEKYFAEKGIPYKRGYILEGEYGTGKTSILKAISNEYKLNIFSVDLDNIETNAQLLKLITDINYMIRNQKYMLVFEDLDRSPFIKKLNRDRYDYCNEGNTSKLTITTFINILDGLVETTGRLLFFTANDLSQLTRNKVIIRPGRIDKTVRITYCNLSQIYRITQLFFPELGIEESRIKPKENLSPAHYIQFLQLNINDTSKIVDYLYEKDKESIKIFDDDNDNKEIKSLDNLKINLRRKNTAKNPRKIKFARKTILKTKKMLDNWDQSKVDLENKIKKLEKYVEKSKKKKKKITKKIKKRVKKTKKVVKRVNNIEKSENEIILKKLNNIDTIFTGIDDELIGDML